MQKNGHDIHCAQCGQMMHISGSRAGKQYCSRQCSRASKICVVNCIVCKEQFSMFVREKAAGRLCCSRKCANSRISNDPVVRHKKQVKYSLSMHSRYRDTSIEKKLRELLLAAGVKFQQQVSIAGVSIVDFYIPATNTVVEADGCYWHGCPVHFPAANMKKQARDVRNNKLLHEAGYSVVRLWEHDIIHMQKVPQDIINI